jgi:Raf kinase inhibitor-like YbhB/YbcL family protein
MTPSAGTLARQVSWRSRAVRGAAAGAALLLLAGCGLVGGTITLAGDVPDVMTVTSPDVSQKGVLGQEFTCRGAGLHPAIHWAGAPARTKALALVMDDSAAPIRPYVYWIVFDIGPQTTDIPPGSLPAGAREAVNSKGFAGYDAPCPRNQAHSYRFTVYALARMLRLPARASLKSAWWAIAHAAIARGRLTATVIP